MTGLEGMSEQIVKQYSNLYGPFAPGVFEVGETVSVHGFSGEVVWSFRKDGVGPLTYVVANENDWPEEVSADKVYGRVSPWTS